MSESDIRTLDGDEVATLVDWAATEGWNPGLDDPSAFRSADPGGFLGLFVDGAMAAGISAVTYGHSFGFIGLYICRSDLRGRGLGRRIWDAAMARLGGRCIGLDGVPEQEANYRKMGFEVAYRTTRFSGKAPEAAIPAGLTVNAAEPGTALAAYDAATFPGRRAPFLSTWIASPRIARMAVRDGRIRGYGVVRKCRDGWKVGPSLPTPWPREPHSLPRSARRRAGRNCISTCRRPDTASGCGWNRQASPPASPRHACIAEACPAATRNGRWQQRRWNWAEAGVAAQPRGATRPIHPSPSSVVLRGLYSAPKQPP